MQNLYGKKKILKNRFCALCTAGGKMCTGKTCDCSCHEEN